MLPIVRFLPGGEAPPPPQSLAQWGGPLPLGRKSLRWGGPHPHCEFLRWGSDPRPIAKVWSDGEAPPPPQGFYTMGRPAPPGKKKFAVGEALFPSEGLLPVGDGPGRPCRPPAAQGDPPPIAKFLPRWDRPPWCEFGDLTEVPVCTQTRTRSGFAPCRSPSRRPRPPS